MDHRNDILISAHDAEALALMLRDHRREDPFSADASDELADIVMEARLLAEERLPADRVAMHSTVTYLEDPGAVRRTVTLVYPHEAHASSGRISVLSPIGLTLIGRKRGTVVALELPNGRSVSIKILAISRSHDALREAA
jgi:regulator of nucleoside diphosphate kinase